jgi:hypothetical protein
LNYNEKYVRITAMEALKYFYLYKITNKINGTIYIGVHETFDLDDGYMGSGLLIQKAIKKYGIENFDKNVIEFFDNRLSMLDKEGEIVTEDFVKRKDNYNIDLGGRGDSKNLRLGTAAFLKKLEDDDFREEYCKKVSVRMKEYYRDNESWWVGKKHKEETKKKIGEANSKIQKGEGNSQHGTRWICNLELEQNKKIGNDEDIPDGWEVGRIQDFKKYKEKIEFLERLELERDEKILQNSISKIQEIKEKRERREKEETKRLERIKFYNENFYIYEEKGFKEFCRITGYNKSHPNLVQQFAKYVKEFIPKNGKRRGK